MRNLVKYVGIGLLVVGLAACDNSDTKTPAQGASAESNATGQPVSLLDGKLSLPSRRVTGCPVALLSADAA